METSENIRRLQPSATLAMAARARELRAQGRDVLDLSAGEPDLPTPAFIRAAGVAAIEKGLTKYTAVAGIPELRQAIADNIQRRTGATVSPAGVVVSNGAKQALFNACFALFGPGDHVLLPRPYWTSYPDLIRLARAEPIYVDGDPERGFKLTPDDLERMLDSSVKGLLLNSPCNPTGAVYSREELEALVRWACERDLWLISDEIYSSLCYVEHRATSLFDLDRDLCQRAVVVDGASKAFAMTGWRIGFTWCDPKLAKKMEALQSHITSNTAAPSQYAALAAFSARGQDDEALRTLADTFRERRDLIVSLFREHLPGVGYVEPEGAFYLFFRVPPGEGSGAFCERLLEQTGLALVPGEAFGNDEFVRLSFAAPDSALRDGVRRLESAMRGDSAAVRSARLDAADAPGAPDAADAAD